VKACALTRTYVHMLCTLLIGKLMARPRLVLLPFEKTQFHFLVKIYDIKGFYSRRSSKVAEFGSRKFLGEDLGI